MVGLWKQFERLCKTILITLLAYSVGDINLTFKTVYSNVLDLLIWLFENKDGEVIFPMEPACFSYFWAAQRGKAQVLCFLIQIMKFPYKFWKDWYFLPKYENPSKQKIKREVGRQEKRFWNKGFFFRKIIKLDQPCWWAKDKLFTSFWLNSFFLFRYSCKKFISHNSLRIPWKQFPKLFLFYWHNGKSNYCQFYKRKPDLNFANPKLSSDWVQVKVCPLKYSLF